MLRPRLLTALSLGLALGTAAPVLPQESSDWGDMFADFFMGPKVKDEFRWSGAVPRGKTLEIKGINGGIRALAKTDGPAEVVAVRSGRRRPPSEVKIEVVEHEGGVTLCAVYPGGGSSGPYECKPGDRTGRLGARNSDVQVDFVVKVPPGVAFAGRTVNGSVETERLPGNVAARTVNGEVSVVADGYVSAETVNGSIDAVMGRTDWKDALALKTVNGSITLTVPANADATLEAKSVNGSITTDVPLTAKSQSSHRQLTGTLGAGGRQLALSTVNGGIHLRR